MRSHLVPGLLAALLLAAVQAGLVAVVLTGSAVAGPGGAVLGLVVVAAVVTVLGGALRAVARRSRAAH